MTTPSNTNGTERPRCNFAVVRQHTPIRVSLDTESRLVCVEIVGDHSVVLLGLTMSGGDTLIRLISDGCAHLAEATDSTHVLDPRHMTTPIVSRHQTRRGT
jgi:hypothetical protein